MKTEDKEALKARQEANILRKKLVPFLRGNIFRRQIIQLRPNTCVELWITFKGIREKAVGFTKVSWPDEWDAKKGEDLAIEKALHRLARQIVARDPAYARLVVEETERQSKQVADETACAKATAAIYLYAPANAPAPISA